MRLGGEAPDQGGDGHEGGQQQQDVWEELRRPAFGCEEEFDTGLKTQKIFYINQLSKPQKMLHKATVKHNTKPLAMLTFYF